MEVRLSTAVCALSLLLIGWAATPCRGESAWGHVRGRFVWEGALPAPRVLKVAADGPTIPDESLLVNADNRGIANILVYMTTVPRDNVIPVHPLYAKAARREVFITIHEHRFAPHLTIVQTSQILVIKNQDTVAHGPSFATLRNQGFNQSLRPGERGSVTFRHAERSPVMATGSIHPWLRGYLLITDHPYATLTDGDGEFEIKHLPAGQRVLSFWHERAGHITSVAFGNQAATWEKGRATIHVQPGTYDMGDIRISSAQFPRP